MKYSIIIPCYNVEKYISKCLDSIKNQTYKNFEVIIVNDGSKDNTLKMIEPYLKDSRFKLYDKKNTGVSDTRNYGIKCVNGDYFIFVDSDDYIELDLLEKLDNIVKKHEYDLVKYYLNLVDEKGALIKSEKFHFKFQVSPIEVLQDEFSDTPVLYLYKTSFFKKNNFKYAVGRVHEDYGLTPYIILKAKDIYSIDYHGYNYVQRENSIVHGLAKNKKRCEDMLYHFNNLYDIISKDIEIKDNIKKYTLSYLANGLISKGAILNKNDLKWYIRELKKMGVFDYLMDDTLIRKVKKIIIKLCPYLYIKSLK